MRPRNRKEGAMIVTLIPVALGGALGAVLRFLTVHGISRMVGNGFPLGTVVVNVAGSFAMGVLVSALTSKAPEWAAPLFLSGFLGGFTTFSAFSLDAIMLWERGALLAAAGYVAASVIFSLAALLAGLFVARQLL